MLISQKALVSFAAPEKKDISVVLGEMATSVKRMSSQAQGSRFNPQSPTFKKQNRCMLCSIKDLKLWF